MNKNILLYLLSFSCLCGITSCMNSTVEEADFSIPKQESDKLYHYDGTIYEYLQENELHPDGVAFDSLLLLLNYPDSLFSSQRDSLMNAQGKYTLFAVPDEGFAQAVKSMNIYRRLNNLTGQDGDLSLTKLLQSRHVVYRSNPDSTELNPLPPTEVVFEYKHDLDSLSARYIFSGEVDTEFLFANQTDENYLVKECIRYGYRMSMGIERMAASGVEDAGLKRFLFYDINNTLQSTKWDVSPVKWMDVYATNGVIHIMNPGHEFGYAEFVQRFKKYGHEE